MFGFILVLTLPFFCIFAAYSTHVLLAKNVDNSLGTKVIPSTADIKHRAEQFSFIGWQVVKVFESLPEANRPVLNIEAAVKALDFKYEATRVNDHFPYHSVSRINGRVHCDCFNRYNTYLNDNHRKAKEINKCQRFAEYTDLITEMQGIQRAIREQEAALAKQEHALQLAGMQNDLDSVAAITEHFRNEKAILRDTTGEIYRQTASIE